MKIRVNNFTLCCQEKAAKSEIGQAAQIEGILNKSFNEIFKVLYRINEEGPHKGSFAVRRTREVRKGVISRNMVNVKIVEG